MIRFTGSTRCMVAVEMRLRASDRLPLSWCGLDLEGLVAIGPSDKNKTVHHEQVKNMARQSRPMRLTPSIQSSFRPSQAHPLQPR